MRAPVGAPPKNRFDATQWQRDSMFNPSRSTARERSRFRSLSALMFISAVAAGTMAACSKDSSTEPASPQLVYGPEQTLGSGTARVYVTLDAAGKPSTLGVALSENALTNLPQMPMGGGNPSAVMLMLALPQAAKATGFDHVMLDWNPAGHEPEHVYTLPHFDFHFYTASQAEQMAIMPSDPQFEAKLEKMPAEQYRPAGLFKLPGGVPMMGAHWVDPTSPELLPAPSNKQFTGTFIYGSYDGKFIFWEPMITKAHIESAKSVAGNAIVTALKTPVQYQRAGYYPDRYTVRWDASAKEYQISMDGLKPQR